MTPGQRLAAIAQLDQLKAERELCQTSAYALAAPASEPPTPELLAALATQHQRAAFAGSACATATVSGPQVNPSVCVGWIRRVTTVAAARPRAPYPVGVPSTTSLTTLRSMQ